MSFVVAWVFAQDSEDKYFMSGLIEGPKDIHTFDDSDFESIPDALSIQGFPSKEEALAWIERERADHEPLD